MGNIKEINVKNSTYYFFNDMTNIKNLTQTYQKQTKSRTKTLIHYIEFITIRNFGDFESIYSIKPLLVKWMDTLN